MNRQQLYHAIRAAGAIAAVDRVIIVGSQSILGSFPIDELPAITHMSAEIDVMPDVDDFDLMVQLSDLIEGVAGELSSFEAVHGFALDGVDLTTSVLPLGWRDRLVEVSNEFTRDPVTQKQYTGLCLDPADLCVAKLCAGREKDRAFVTALFAARLVDPAVVWERLHNMPTEHTEIAALVLAEHARQHESDG